MTPRWTSALIVNGFAILCLLILLVNFDRKQRRFILKDQLIFRYMLLTNIVMLLLDAGTWVLDGMSFAGARDLNLAVTAAYYALNPLMSVLYALFCDVKIGTPPDTRRRLLYVYLLPISVNLVLTVLSLWSPLLFRIGPDNVYSRAPFLALSFVLSYLLLPLSFGRVLAYLIRSKDSIEPISGLNNRHATFTLLVFPVAPLLGGIMQAFWDMPITVVWLTTVFMQLIIFINIQNSQIFTDELTGLYNRRQTVAYLQSLLQPSIRERPVCLAILDVDNFKQINDRYGHLAGDRALRVLASALQRECDRNTFISRYGGDEFIIITRQCDAAMTADLLRRVDHNLREYCLKENLPYALSISAGVAVRGGDIQTIDALYAAADAELYRQKARMSRRAGDLRQNETIGN